MPAPSRLTLAACLVLAAIASPLFAKGGKDESEWSTDRLDAAWAERAIAHPGLDRGWCMSCRDWSDGRVAHCEVREFSYSQGRDPIAIDGGVYGGMTVMGWDRDDVRVLYRVITRARTEEQARDLAERIQLERTQGWVRAHGPEAAKGEWWAVEVKAWVPRTSKLALKVENGPLGVRDVRGTMDLNSINGPMSLVDLGGAIEARVENGPLHVALAGPRWDGAGLDAEAQNGPVNLVLPSDYSAKLVTGTINGPSAYDYALTTRLRSHDWITTTLGKGGPLVRVVTSNGPFHITTR